LDFNFLFKFKSTIYERTNHYLLASAS